MTFAKTLSRDEMKNVVAGSYCSCSYGDCVVDLYQGPSSWGMMVTCREGQYGQEGTWYDGAGEYGGTVCGGECP